MQYLLHVYTMQQGCCDDTLTGLQPTVWRHSYLATKAQHKWGTVWELVYARSGVEISFHPVIKNLNQYNGIPKRELILDLI